MNVFDWFRRKRNSPPGKPLPPPDEIEIPLSPVVMVGYLVYFRVANGQSPPSSADARQITLDWVAEHSTSPLRELVEEVVRQDFLTADIEARDSVPDPPDNILRAYNPGEVEERRFREATHVAFVGAQDLLLPPRPGLWSVLAMSRALAERLPNAVIIDPEFPRLLPLPTVTPPLPQDARLYLVDHILVPYSFDESSHLLWITTKGMARFGLPDMEIRDVPPNLAQALLPVMNGLAQRLARQATRFLEDHPEDLEAETMLLMPAPAEFTFTAEDIRRAYDRTHLTPLPLEHTEEEQFTGQTRLRLEPVPLTSEEDAPVLLRVLPPRGTTDDMGIWLNRMLDELYGSQSELEMVAQEDARMAQAHRKAMEEFPLIRTRFQRGFRSGEVLHIKHGFALENGGHEYMWVAVTRWDGNRISGYLANDPQYRRDLSAGTLVTMDEADIFDWMVVHSDGTLEGAYTNRVLLDNDS